MTIDLPPGMVIQKYHAAGSPVTKSNARAVAVSAAQSVRPGDLVVVTQPEQVPVLRYYLGPGYRWATTLGRMPDPLIFDWRDAVSRWMNSSNSNIPFRFGACDSNPSHAHCPAPATIAG